MNDNDDKYAPKGNAAWTPPQPEELKTWYQRNKKTVNTTAVVVVLAVLNKRTIKKAVAKGVAKGVTKGFNIEVKKLALEGMSSENKVAVHNAFLAGFDHAIECVDWAMVNAEKIGKTDLNSIYKMRSNPFPAA